MINADRISYSQYELPCARLSFDFNSSLSPPRFPVAGMNLLYLAVVLHGDESRRGAACLQCHGKKENLPLIL
jgi:hypothetical protein